MAKLKPLILLGGAAAALFVFSKRKKGDKKASSESKPDIKDLPEPPAKDPCRSIPLGDSSVGEMFDVLMDFVKSREGDYSEEEALPPRAQELVDALGAQYVKPLVDQLPPTLIDAPQSDLIDIATHHYNELFPECEYSQAEAKQLAYEFFDHASHEAMEKLQPREMLYILFTEGVIVEIYDRYGDPEKAPPVLGLF